MAAQKNPKLTIIIVTHNSAAVIHDCLKEISDSPYPIIIVDCDSSDNAIAEIKQKYPNIKIIASEKNLGYGRANNLGATHAESDYLLFLNPDAIIQHQDISLAVKMLDTHSQIGVAGVQIKGEEGYAGVKDGNLLYKSSILGAVFFVKVALFTQLQGFDEKIFLYGEENDLCSRVEKAGFKNAVILDAQASHINRGSSPNKWQYDYLRGYHSCWSKLYLRQKRKGLYKTSYIILKFMIRSFILLLISLATLDKHKAAWYMGGVSGSINFMLGRKAFDKHNNPRGFIKI